MLAEERQVKIYTMVQETGAISSVKLAKKFNVSAETIRRDLIVLEKSGLLVKVHGGAVRSGKMISSVSLSNRLMENSNEKTELAQKAAAFLNDGDIIGLDAGSTAVAFANVICSNFTGLTVVTHSLDVFNIMKDAKSFNPILIGGMYLNEEKAFHGNITRNILKDLHVQKAFMCPSAISLKNGVRDYDPKLIAISKLFYEICDEAFFLADSSKYEKNALYKLADLNVNDTFITDNSLSDDLRELYKQNQVNVI